MDQYFKVCPKCNLQTNIQTQQCGQCGHLFSTQFINPNQTQAFSSGMGQPPMPVQVQNVPHSGGQPASPIYQYPDPYGSLQPSPGHSIALVIVLHILLTGAGQMYNGQVGKGFLLFGCTILFACLFWPIAVCLWVIALIDAIMIGGKRGRKYVGHWEFF